MKVNGAILYQSIPISIDNTQVYDENGISNIIINTNSSPSSITINLPANITWDIQTDSNTDLYTSIVYDYNNGKIITQMPVLSANSVIFENPVHFITTSEATSAISVTFNSAYNPPLIRQYVVQSKLPQINNWCDNINLMSAYEDKDNIVITLDLTSLSSTALITVSATF